MRNGLSFLVGIIETAKSSIATFDNILKLEEETNIKIHTLGSRPGNAQKIIHYLYPYLLIDAAKIGNVVERSSASPYKLIADLERLGIFREVPGAKRGKWYAFDTYIALFK